MAYVDTQLSKADGSMTIGEKSQQLWTYKNTADAIATISASGYFNSATAKLKQYDVIFVEASDDRNIFAVTSASGAATVTVASIVDASVIPDLSITNAKVAAGAAIDFSKLAALTSANILVGNGSNVATSVAMSGDVAIDNAGATTIQAGAVEKSMLAATVRPSDMIVYSGQVTTVGGAAAEAFTVTGALNTDLGFVQVVDDGSSNVTVLQAVMTADTLTVTFSGNPGNDTIINYQVVRATS